MLTAQNPYIAGNPVSDQTAFVGRLDVLRELRTEMEGLFDLLSHYALPVSLTS